MDPLAASATDVSFAYDGVLAVDGVSMSIPEGTAAALLGPNGAGKTTFVRLLTGSLTPDEGTLSLFGEPPTASDRQRLGVLPQAFAPPERLTPRELLRYYGGLYDEARAPGAVIDELGLEDAADRQYRRLSGGQQRRCCLGIAMINDPDFLVLDEPTAGIDPGGKRTLWRYLPELVEAGTTLLVTTHDMVEAERLAERIGFFHGGRLLAFDTADALVSEHLGQRRLHIEADDLETVASALDGAVIRDDAVQVESVEQASLPEIVERALATDAELTSVRWDQPPLEELFTTMVDPGEAMEE